MSCQLRICSHVYTRVQLLRLTSCHPSSSILYDSRRFLHQKRQQFYSPLQMSICSLPHTVHQQQKRNISAETIQYFYSPEFPPVGFAQKLLEVVYDTTGLPWWGTILLTTVALRTAVTLPIAVYAQWNVLKIQQLRPILKEKGERLKYEVAAAKKRYKWSNEKAMFMFRKNVSSMPVVNNKL